MLVKALVIASIGWPVLLAIAGWQTIAGRPARWTMGTYVAASVVCHQRSARSFHSAGVKWPVCARCSGLYLAAPIGAMVAASGARFRGRWSRPNPGLTPRARLLAWLALSAVPTVVTWSLEWLAAVPVSNAARFLAALPLGAMVAAVLVYTVHGLD
jgi:uncharacterized membrane protein